MITRDRQERTGTMTETFLVIGGNGRVGREVVDQLLDAGHGVRAIVRSEAKVPSLKRDGIELVIGDIGDASILAPAMKGLRKAYVATSDDDTSVAKFEVFLETARDAELEHIVRLSAMSADAEADGDLSRRHGQRELALEESGMDWTHLQPTWFMQMMLEYAPGGHMDLPGGDGRIPWIDTRDIAAVAVAALTTEDHNCKTYQLTGPAGLSYGDLAAQMSKATGRDFVYRDVPADEYRAMMVDAGEDPGYIDLVLQIYERISDGQLSTWHDGVQKALGREAIDFATFCSDYADDLIKQL
jgi:uncharacterized protein YbjT (DUF2867 family)